MNKKISNCLRAALAIVDGVILAMLESLEIPPQKWSTTKTTWASMDIRSAVCGKAGYVFTVINCEHNKSSLQFGTQ